jgi:Fic family protein
MQMPEQPDYTDCPEWEEGPETERARAQRERVLAQIILSDHKKLPSAELVRDWHRKLFEGIAPHPDYLGNFRNLEKVPKCVQYLEVAVNGNNPIKALPAARVLDAVDRFIEEFIYRVSAIDEMWAAMKETKPPLMVDQIVKTAAWAHGEWVRIHPFANGNGRTSRLWVNYVFIRFGFAPLKIRPRPDNPYGFAAECSMRYRDHSIMESVLWDLLWESLRDRIDELLNK